MHSFVIKLTSQLLEYMLTFLRLLLLYSQPNVKTSCKLICRHVYCSMSCSSQSPFSILPVLVFRCVGEACLSPHIPSASASPSLACSHVHTYPSMAACMQNLLTADGIHDIMNFTMVPFGLDTLPSVCLRAPYRVCMSSMLLSYALKYGDPHTSWKWLPVR